VALAMLLAAVLIYGRTSGAQSKRGAKSTGADARVKRVLKSTGEPAAPKVRNPLLSTELSWTFGSKQQRGWYLYKPLIDRLLDTKHAVGSDGFAKALERWQQKSGLLPNGVLDDETLYAMIKTWQEDRLKDRSPAAPEQLLTAPVADFYDPTRAEELRQVERETYAAYKRMVSAALSNKSLGLARGAKGELAPQEKFLKIISSFRSKEYQEKLRRESPGAGSAGLAVNSPHFTGRALDLYVGGEPVDTRDSNRAIQVETRVYQWLVKNADRFGFRPYCYEPWHWEYVGKK
jgi:D-alanyl-D-alanine carboxypeptidase